MSKKYIGYKGSGYNPKKNSYSFKQDINKFCLQGNDGKI